MYSSRAFIWVITLAFRFRSQENELSSVKTQTVPLECTRRQLSWVVSFTRKWTLFNNNTNSTIRMYSTRTFIWVVTLLALICLSDQDLEVFWFKSNSLLTVKGLMAGWLQKTAYKAWSEVQMKHIHGKRSVVTSNFIEIQLSYLSLCMMVADSLLLLIYSTPRSQQTRSMRVANALIARGCIFIFCY